MWKEDHHYYVYLLSSRTRILYCGMSNDLMRRVAEHKAGTAPGFTAAYRCERLVWYERHQYVLNAIDREKEIKSWTRAKKIALIEKENPSWSDLSDAWTK
ncbi:MAG: GIY-YIG nuclease family protein [Acidobacteriaceae bacterium]